MDSKVDGLQREGLPALLRVGVGYVFQADSLPVFRQPERAVEGGGVVGKTQIGKGLQGDFALHQHGIGTDGGVDGGAHKQQGHADNGGIGGARPAVVVGKVVDDADGGEHDAVAPVA